MRGVGVAVAGAVVAIGLAASARADSWQELSPAKRPAARAGHGMAVIGGTAYLFGGQKEASPGAGGQVPREPGEMINDLWSYSEEFVEVVPDKDPGSPPARRDHATVTSSGQMFTVFGKDAQGFLYEPDMWFFIPGTKQWSEKPVSSPPRPLKRTNGCKLVLKDGRILYTGGIGEGSPGSVLTDLWAYDPETNQWTQKAFFPGKARWGHKCEVSSDGNKLYLWGGTNGTEIFNDLWVYDVPGNTWGERRHARQAGPPPGRSRHVSVALAESMLIAGGEGAGGQVLDDTWEYKFSDGSWTQRASLPVGVSEADAVVLSSGQVLLFGGKLANGRFTDRVFRYTPDATQVPASSLPLVLVSLAGALALAVRRARRSRRTRRA